MARASAIEEQARIGREALEKKKHALERGWETRRTSRPLPRAQHYSLGLSDMLRSQSAIGSGLTGGSSSRSRALRTQRSAAATR